MEKDIVFEKLKQLTEIMLTANETAEKSDNQNTIEENEMISDNAYKEYFYLVEENFDKMLIKSVQAKVGLDKFCTLEFYNALYEMYKVWPTLVDEYKGFVLKRSLDCFGTTAYFVYYQNRQYSDGMDFGSDDNARFSFRAELDRCPNDPSFSDQ